MRVYGKRRAWGVLTEYRPRALSKPIGTCTRSFAEYLDDRMMRQLVRLPTTRGLPCVSFYPRTTESLAVRSYSSLTSGKLGGSIEESLKSKYQFALPVRLADGRPVTGSADWDDYPLWVATFAARGAGRWRETDKREVPEFGLEFRSTGP